MSTHYTKPRENSVKNLQTLYSIVIGLGLVQSIQTVVVDPVGKFDIALIPYFLSYLFLLVPFYHGALRHLDRTYVEAPSKRVRSGALMADFLLLFIEAVVFLTLSMLLNRNQQFAWLLVALLLLDSLWGFLAHLAFSDNNRETSPGKGWAPEGKWAAINVITATIVVLFIIFSPRQPLGPFESFGIGLSCICFLRTVCDYMLTWDFYFPPISD